MTVFDDFIADKIASGDLTDYAIVQTPEGVDVLFYVDPEGIRSNSTEVTPLLNIVYYRNGVLLNWSGGIQVEADTRLDIVDSPNGLAVEFERLAPSSQGPFAQFAPMLNENGFVRMNIQKLNDYTGNPEDIGYNSIGDEFNNSLFGTGEDDVMKGKAGDDYLEGASGNDIMYGGAGDDLMYGEAGNDTIMGNNGKESIFGGAGDDVIKGGGDGDFIRGGNGNDFILGGDGGDGLFGGAGEDELRGGRGSDGLYGGDGADVLRGNGESDGVYGGKSNDILYGGLGVDFIGGGTGKDLIYGGKGGDFIEGGKHNDLIFGGNGSDTFKFSDGDGKDTIADYDAKYDIIDLRNFDVTVDAVSMEQKGTSVLVEIGSTDILLLNTDLADMEDATFLF